jgi:hypothetical protein
MSPPGPCSAAASEEAARLAGRCGRNVAPFDDRREATTLGEVVGARDADDRRNHPRNHRPSRTHPASFENVSLLVAIN